MNCPNCQIPLQLAERQNVEIDYCPQCRGVWLDRGELDKIIERGNERSDERPPKKEYHEHAVGYRKKRRESFLGELFDF